MSAAVATRPSRGTLDADWAAFQAARPAGEPAWLGALRAAAAARFAGMGLPTTRDEDWRQTPVTAIARTRFVPAPAVSADPAAFASVTFPDGFDGQEVVMVNGRLDPALGGGGVQAGLRVLSLQDVLAREPQVLQGVLDTLARDRADAFAVLNTAFLEDGVLVDVPANHAGHARVHVIHCAAPDGAPTVAHPRLFVRVGRAAQLTLVESFAGPDGAPYFTNAVTEVLVGDGAVVDHYRVQREGADAFHVATLAVRQERASRFSSHSIALGASLSRLDVNHVFGGEGGECVLNGLFMGADGQLLDTHTRIDHAHPHCVSRETYRGILDGQARGVFVGRVLVRKDAQKTDAQQVNKNLLLSREALVHSVPQLEILADDVKCKHGSTTGQLDPLALFYLRARGIGESAARSLLIYAFASDVLSRIALAPLRRGLGEYLRAHLPDAPGPGEAVV